MRRFSLTSSQDTQDESGGEDEDHVDETGIDIMEAQDILFKPDDHRKLDVFQVTNMTGNITGDRNVRQKQGRQPDVSPYSGQLDDQDHAENRIVVHYGQEIIGQYDDLVAGDDSVGCDVLHLDSRLNSHLLTQDSMNKSNANFSGTKYRNESHRIGLENIYQSLRSDRNIVTNPSSAQLFYSQTQLTKTSHSNLSRDKSNYDQENCFQELLKKEESLMLKPKPLSSPKKSKHCLSTTQSIEYLLHVNDARYLSHALYTRGMMLGDSYLKQRLINLNLPPGEPDNYLKQKLINLNIPTRESLSLVNLVNKPLSQVNMKAVIRGRERVNSSRKNFFKSLADLSRVNSNNLQTSHNNLSMELNNENTLTIHSLQTYRCIENEDVGSQRFDESKDNNTNIATCDNQVRSSKEIDDPKDDLKQNKEHSQRRTSEDICSETKVSSHLQNIETLYFSAEVCLDSDTGLFVNAELRIRRGENIVQVNTHSHKEFIQIQISSIERIEIEDSRRLLNIFYSEYDGNTQGMKKEVKKLMIPVYFSDSLAAGYFVGALELEKRRSHPLKFEGLLYPLADIVSSKLVNLHTLCQWRSINKAIVTTASKVVIPLGEFWYKQGNYRDTRDWEQACFYIKCGVLYGARRPGDLPCVAVSLFQVKIWLPEPGNRFLLRVTSNLTISSPSAVLCRWLLGVLNTASNTKVEPQDEDGRIIQHLIITSKKVQVFAEPSRCLVTQVNISDLMRVMYDASTLSFHLHWLSSKFRSNTDSLSDSTEHKISSAGGDSSKSSGGHIHTTKSTKKDMNEQNLGGCITLQCLSQCQQFIQEISQHVNVNQILGLGTLYTTSHN